MKISCSECGAQYTITADKVAGKVVKVRCKACTNPIVIDARGQSAEELELADQQKEQEAVEAFKPPVAPPPAGMPGKAKRMATQIGLGPKEQQELEQRFGTGIGTSSVPAPAPAAAPPRVPAAAPPRIPAAPVAASPQIPAARPASPANPPPFPRPANLPPRTAALGLTRTTPSVVPPAIPSAQRIPAVVAPSSPPIAPSPVPPPAMQPPAVSSPAVPSPAMPPPRVPAAAPPRIPPAMRPGTQGLAPPAVPAPATSTQQAARFSSAPPPAQTISAPPPALGRFGSTPPPAPDGMGFDFEDEEATRVMDGAELDAVRDDAAADQWVISRMGQETMMSELEIRASINEGILGPRTQARPLSGGELQRLSAIDLFAPLFEFSSEELSTVTAGRSQTILGMPAVNPGNERRQELTPLGSFPATPQNPAPTAVAGSLSKAGTAQGLPRAAAKLPPVQGVNHAQLSIKEKAPPASKSWIAWLLFTITFIGACLGVFWQYKTHGVPPALQKYLPQLSSKAPIPFNAEEAKIRLAAIALQAEACAAKAEDPTGPGKVELRFLVDGSVDIVKFIDGDFAGSDSGRCVLALFEKARVPAFSGSPLEATKSFVVRAIPTKEDTEQDDSSQDAPAQEQSAQ